MPRFGGEPCRPGLLWQHKEVHGDEGWECSLRQVYEVVASFMRIGVQDSALWEASVYTPGNLFFAFAVWDGKGVFWASVLLPWWEGNIWELVGGMGFSFACSLKVVAFVKGSHYYWRRLRAGEETGPNGVMRLGKSRSRAFIIWTQGSLGAVNTPSQACPRSEERRLYETTCAMPFS